MKIKKILQDAALYLVVLLVGTLPGYLISNGIFGMIASVSTDDKRLFRIVNFVPFLTFVAGVLLFVSFRREYKREKFRVPETAVSAVLACGIHLLIAKILSFAVYVSGPALYLSEIIVAGENTGRILAYTDIPDHVYVLTMLAVDAVYVCAAIFGGYAGVKKRRMERKALTEKE